MRSILVNPTGFKTNRFFVKNVSDDLKHYVKNELQPAVFAICNNSGMTSNATSKNGPGKKNNTGKKFGTGKSGTETKANNILSIGDKK